MQINEVLAWLKSVSWLGSLGDHADEQFPYVTDIAEAKKLMLSRKFSTAQAEAISSIRDFFYDRRRQAEIQDWNDCVTLIKSDFINGFDFSKLERAFGRGGVKTIVSAVEWDIGTLAQFMRYGDEMGDSKLHQLRAIYEAGHIAGGWTGKSFPEGDYMVF